MKIYIPFNMVIDTDFGAIKLLDMTQHIKPWSKNKIKSFLLTREAEDPLIEYMEDRYVNAYYESYDVMIDKYYDSVLALSEPTDMLAFIINTYKFGFGDDVQIVIGCDEEREINHINKVFVNSKFSVESILNTEAKLNDYDCIFIKYLDLEYVDFLLDAQDIRGKKLYVADYRFNTIYDVNTEEFAISPALLGILQGRGNVVYTVSLYNQRRK